MTAPRLSLACVAFLLLAAMLSTCGARRPEEGQGLGLSAFFLKAAKSVPRVGRSSRGDQLDGFFLKPPKSIPRMGKKDEDSVGDVATANQLFAEQLAPPAVLRRRFANDDYDSNSWRPQPNENLWNYEGRNLANDNPDEFGYSFDGDQYSRQKRGATNKYGNLERVMPTYQQTTT